MVVCWLRVLDTSFWEGNSLSHITGFFISSMIMLLGIFFYGIIILISHTCSLRTLIFLSVYGTLSHSMVVLSSTLLILSLVNYNYQSINNLVNFISIWVYVLTIFFISLNIISPFPFGACYSVVNLGFLEMLTTNASMLTNIIPSAMTTCLFISVSCPGTWIYYFLTCSVYFITVFYFRYAVLGSKMLS